MTRHKSRVARRNRRSARRGTRKQSGGMFKWLFGSNPADPAAQQATPVAAQPAAPAAQQATPAAGDKEGYLSGFFNFFKSKDTSVKDTSVGPSTPAPHQGGGRKTRHRRQSARRHHK